jgi:hypothetical protein
MNSTSPGDQQSQELHCESAPAAEAQAKGFVNAGLAISHVWTFRNVAPHGFVIPLCVGHSACQNFGTLSFLKIEGCAAILS